MRRTSSRCAPNANGASTYSATRAQAAWIRAAAYARFLESYGQGRDGVIRLIAMHHMRI